MSIILDTVPVLALSLHERFGPPVVADIARTIEEESFRVVGKNRFKYLTTVTSLWGYRLADPVRGLVAQAAYFSLRCIDDAIDGDMIATDPKAFAQGIRGQIINDEWNEQEPVSQMIKFAIEGLEVMAPEEDVRGDFLTVIDAMLFDHVRAQERTALSNEELGRYYWDTFAPPFNLFLIGTGSNVRIQELPLLPNAMARLNSLRDLDEDWPRGIINIPQEILEHAQLSSQVTIDEVKVNRVIQRWSRSERSKAKKDLRRMTERIRRLDPGVITKLPLTGMIWRLNKSASN